MANFVELTFKCTNKLLKFIGPLFVIVIITFLIYTYLSIIKNIFPFWYLYFYPYESNKIFYISYKSLLTIELFLALLNNFLAIIIKPGNISDIRKSKYYKTHSPYFSEKLLFPIFPTDNSRNNMSIIDIEKGIKETDINKTKKFYWEKCKICKEIKPLRTHHCSLCGSCVIKMDHHCPWINNCIGQNNHRYFLLFLLHIFLYTVLGTIISFPILISSNNTINKKKVNAYEKEPNMKEIKYIAVLGISCIIIEIFFCGWSWYLALSGNTTLEFWSSKTGYQLFQGIDNYSFGTWEKNLFYIFGTTNLFKIAFIPSFKKLPFSGIEISKFIDSDFCIEGIN
jgi:palmitoyltransferase